EVGGSHPLARAFAAHDRGLECTNVHTLVGQGVAGRVDGVDWRLGRPGFAGPGSDDGCVWLADGTGLRARFRLQDALRTDAAAAIASVQALGLRCEIASGDHDEAVQQVAGALSIAL